MSQSDYIRVRAAEKLKFLMGLPDAVIRFEGDKVDGVLKITIENYPDHINSMPGQLLTGITHAKVTSERGENSLTITVGDETEMLGDQMLLRIADCNLGAPKPVLH